VNTILQDEKNASEVLCLVRESRVDEESKYWESNKNCVKVMKYDMLDGGTSVENALEYIFSDNNNHEECCIFHVASVFNPCKEHEQMALDNVKGAEDLIAAVAKFPRDKTRVILTSSMAGE